MIREIFTAGVLMSATNAAAQDIQGTWSFSQQAPLTVRSDPKMRMHIYSFGDVAMKKKHAGDAMVDEAAGILCERATDHAVHDNNAAYRCKAATVIPDVWKKAVKSGGRSTTPIVKEILYKEGTSQIVEASVQVEKKSDKLSFNFRVWNLATRNVCLHASEGKTRKGGDYEERSARHWGCFSVHHQNKYYDDLLKRLKITRSI